MLKLLQPATPLPKLENILRVATFNVHLGAQPELIAESLLTNPHLKEADIFLLQEVEHHGSEGETRAHKIAARLGMEAAYTPARELAQSGTHGLAIISKHPITESQSLSVPYFNLGFHSRTRIAVYSKISIGPVHIGFYNIHLDTRLNTKERVQQLTAALGDASMRGDVFSIFAGDFNTLPFIWLKRILPMFYANQKLHIKKFMESHKFKEVASRGPTMRQGLIRFKLDAIYSRGLPIVQWGIEKEIRVSDHKPLWADFELPQIKVI